MKANDITKFIAELKSDSVQHRTEIKYIMLLRDSCLPPLTETYHEGAVCPPYARLDSSVFLSHVNTLTRDIDIANLSVRLSVTF